MCCVADGWPSSAGAKVGEVLGMHEEFYLRVLHHYCRSFDFAGLSFEEAFRQFLLAFRLPGACVRA
jgi:Sec7-like guanine-nucleotide exchange factor